MANVFAITPLTDKLKAENGSTKADFTVTNTTSRPLRCIGKIKPLGNTEASWLKIDGEVERDFSPGGTDKYTVIFEKPKPPAPATGPQPAESFQFRFDAVSAANPNEDFTEGPVITVEFPEQKVDEKKPFPWLIVAIIAGLVLVIGGVVLWLVLRDSSVEIPDLKGKNLTEAQALVDEINSKKGTKFKVEKVDVVAPDRAINTIFDQVPQAGTKAEREQVIRVSVPELTTVPRVIGQTYENAKSLIEGKGLTISNHFFTSDAPKTFPDFDLISFQSPLSGTAKKGTEVQVFSPCKTTPCSKLGALQGVKDLEGVKKSLQSIENK